MTMTLGLESDTWHCHYHITLSPPHDMTLT